MNRKVSQIDTEYIPYTVSKQALSLTRDESQKPSSAHTTCRLSTSSSCRYRRGARAVRFANETDAETSFLGFRSSYIGGGGGSGVWGVELLLGTAAEAGRGLL